MDPKESNDGHGSAGANAPHADEVRAFCSSQGYSFVEGTNRMAELMASNDASVALEPRLGNDSASACHQ